MKAVILAGGAGQRLRPLTCTLPKPMVPLMNTPVMEYTVALLGKHEFDSVAVTMQYLPNKIKNHFGDEMYGVSFSYFVEDRPLGTAGSVLHTGEAGESLFIISGDALTDLDITSAIAFHHRKKAEATIVLKRVGIPLEYGVVITDAQGRIERFVEKPDWSQVFGDLVNTGIYILEPSVWEGFTSGETFDFAKDLFPRLLERNAALYGYVTQDYWCDIGSVDSYVTAHRDVFDGKCRLPFQKAENSDGIWVEEGARIHSASVVKGPCYIGKDAVINAGAAIEPYTVIGSGSQVHEGASVKRSIVWENARVGEYAEVRGAVLCANAALERGAAVFEGAVIAQGVSAGEGSIVSTGVRVWPDKRVDAGERLTSDCIWGSCGAKLFTETGIRGGYGELTPEIACRLGRALAATVGENARVGVAADGSAACVLLKQALCAGLMAGGVDVFDLECALKSVLRYGVTSLTLQAAVYLRGANGSADPNTGIIELELLDADGLDMPPGKLRAYRSAYEQGADGAVHPADVGLLRVRSNITGFYVAHILSAVNAQRMRQEPRRVVLHTENAHERELCEELFAGCGWSAVTTSSLEEARRLSRKQGVAALSVGEKSLKVLTSGETVEGGRLDLLIALLELRLGAKELFCDALTPEAAEEIAKKYGATISRLHTQQLVRAAQRDSLTFLARTDPYAAAVALCGHIAALGISFSELIGELPPLVISERSVACAWKDIGRIFRTIAEEQTDSGLERLEGLRVKSKNGYVHLVPASDGRRMRILSGAFSEEYAESLADLYARRAKRICDEHEKE